MKKILMLAAILIFALALAACGGNDEDNGDNGAATGPPVRMGTNVDFPPFQWWYDHEAVGIDIAIANAIAERMGRPLEIIDMDFGALLVALAQGDVDFVAAGMTATGARGEERRESVDFSILYYNAIQAIIVMADDETINNAEDLRGRAVGTVTDWSGDGFAREEMNGNQNWGMTVRPYANPAFSVQALIQGSVDAVIMDYTTAVAIASQNPDLRVVGDENVFEGEWYAIAVRQGDTETMRYVNETLQSLMDSGELDRIIDYYSGRF